MDDDRMNPRKLTWSDGKLAALMQMPWPSFLQPRCGNRQDGRLDEFVDHKGGRGEDRGLNVDGFRSRLMEDVAELNLVG